MSAAYLSVKTLKGAGIVLKAARHNLREIQAELGAAERIDPMRSSQNMCLAGPATAAEVAAQAEQAMLGSGVGKLRRDAVRSVEVVVTLPVGARMDLASFFGDTLAWVRSFFQVPVLSAVVHLDEAAPHMHVLLLPLVGGKMAGSDLLGNRTRMQAMQTAFYEAVARKYGMSRPRAGQRISRALRDKAAKMALGCLKSHPERLQLPDVHLALTNCIADNPEPMIHALGLQMPASKPKREKTLVEIMTRPCKPEPKPNPIGFQPAPRMCQESKPYPCVGFDHSREAIESEYSRVSDEQRAECWDAERGEFRRPPTPKAGLAGVCDTQRRRQ